MTSTSGVGVHILVFNPVLLKSESQTTCFLPLPVWLRRFEIRRANVHSYAMWGIFLKELFCIINNRILWAKTIVQVGPAWVWTPFDFSEAGNLPLMLSYRSSVASNFHVCMTLWDSQRFVIRLILWNAKWSPFGNSHLFLIDSNSFLVSFFSQLCKWSTFAWRRLVTLFIHSPLTAILQKEEMGEGRRGEEREVKGRGAKGVENIMMFIH